MLIIDFETLNIVDANLAACSFYKYSYEEMLQLNITDINILMKDQITHNMNLVKRQIKNNFIFKHRISTGEIKDVNISAGLIYIKEKEYLYSIILDVSERKDTIEQLSKISPEMQVMLDNLPFIAWFKDLQGKYTAVNKHFESYCGTSKEEIVGKNDYEIFPQKEADIYVLGDNNIIAGREKGHFEELIEEHGRWKEEYKSPIIDEFGNIIGTTGITRDITERVLKDKALRDAEQRELQLLEETIAMKDNFITLITHEFKTPLAIIHAAIQTMDVVCENEITNNIKRYINKIKQNSLRQQRLVDNLLDITRIKAGQMKKSTRDIDIVSYTKEITESVKLYAQQKNVKLTFRSICDQKVITIDAEKYERILLNLLSNAIKFTPPKKSIYVKLSIQGFFVQVEVIDKGIGVPREKQDVIFEQFGQVDSIFSRQAEGTGIGLYLVKLLVVELNGTISLKSKENHGSIFTILIPIPQEKSENTYKEINKDSIQDATSLEFSDFIF
jgi:PAS domain S-box-containing protein